MVDDRRRIDYIYLMKEALAEAKKAEEEGEVPVGAVIADKEGRIIARDHNRVISLNDPTAHAEVLVLRKAGKLTGNYRLNDTILVVTIEPCPMCAGAAVNARVKEIVYGAADPKAGSAGTVYDIACSKKLNHRIKITSGILEDNCKALLQEFFRKRRGTEGV